MGTLGRVKKTVLSDTVANTLEIFADKGGWVWLGQGLMLEHSPESGRPSLPNHEAE